MASEGSGRLLATVVAPGDDDECPEDSVGTLVLLAPLMFDGLHCTLVNMISNFLLNASSFVFWLLLVPLPCGLWVTDGRGISTSVLGEGVNRS